MGAIQLTPKQANIYAWGWQPEARFRYAVCGRRFGKTYLAAQEIRRAIRLAVHHDVDPDNEIWYGAPSLKQAKRVFWRRLKRSIPRNWIAKKLENESSLLLQSDHVVRLVGLSEYDNLRGSGLWFFVGDEWADCPVEAWQEVIRPMLATAGGHSLHIGTPKGFDHFYDGFVEGQIGAAIDVRSWQYSTLDGGNVPSAEIEHARRTLDPRTFRQEYEAGFETFSGRIYYAFDRRYNVRRCPLDPRLDLHIGMDFNVNPMSAAVWQRKGAEFEQVDEIVIPTSDTAEMAQEVLSRYGQQAQANSAQITVYPDPAGAQSKTSAVGKTDISILRDAGLRVAAMRSHPQVRDRINLVNAQWQTADGERHAFVDPRCAESIKCYEQHTYKAGTSIPEKNSGLDHLPDATGYFFYTLLGRKPTRSTTVKHMGR